MLTIDENEEDDDFDKEEVVVVRKRSAEDAEGSQNDDWHLEPIVKKAHSDETQNDQDDFDWV